MSTRTATAAPARTRGSSTLPPWLRRRIGIPIPGEPAHEDPTQDRALIARSLSILFLAGATLSVVWLLFPHDPRTADGGVLAMTIGAYLTGVVLIVGLDRLPMSVLKGAVTAATVVITGAVLANHENGSTYVVFYFWATIYAFSFFSLRQRSCRWRSSARRSPWCSSASATSGRRRSRAGCSSWAR